MDSVRVEKLKKERYKDLIKYNKKKFNHNNDDKYFKYRFIDNSSAQDDKNYVLVVVNEENNIIGQMMFLPMSFVADNEVHYGAWGIDMILDKEARGSGIGKKLAQESKKFPNYFVFGVTPASYNIFKKLGFHFLDKFDRYIYIPSVFSIPQLFLKPKNVKNKPFPDQVKTDFQLFKIQHNAPKIDKLCWNSDIIETCRDEDYINWRYFGAYKRFSFYFNEDETNPIFFVLKKLTWRNHEFIVLVDLRLNRKNKEDINDVLKACKVIMKKTGAKGIITGTSLKDLAIGFSKNGFFEFETTTTILTSSKHGANYPYNRKNGIFVNMIDSDFEHVYELKGNLHRRIIKGLIKKIKGSK